jgi:hypothetical protein
LGGAGFEVGLQPSQDVLPAAFDVRQRGRTEVIVDHEQPTGIPAVGDLKREARGRLGRRSCLVDDVEGLDEPMWPVDLEDLAIQVQLAVGRFAGPPRSRHPSRTVERSVPVLGCAGGVRDRIPELFRSRSDADVVAVL